MASDYIHWLTWTTTTTNKQRKTWTQIQVTTYNQSGTNFWSYFYTEHVIQTGTGNVWFTHLPHHQMTLFFPVKLRIRYIVTQKATHLLYHSSAGETVIGPCLVGIFKTRVKKDFWHHAKMWTCNQEDDSNANQWWKPGGMMGRVGVGGGGCKGKDN